MGRRTSRRTRGRSPSDPLGPEAARHRPGAHLGPDRRPRGRPDRREGLVGRGGLGRRLEDDQRRHDLGAGLRRRGLLLDRRARHRPEEPERRLGRHRREQQPAQRRLRRRRLPDARRRQDVEEHGAREVRAHRQDPDRPARLATSSGWRRRDRCGIGGGDRGALQDDRRRRDLEAGRSRSATTPASPTSSSTRAIPTRSTPPPTSAAATSGPWSTADPSRRSTSRPTAARPGASSSKGLPKVDLGRIGLAVSPQNPDVVYAIVEAGARQGRLLPLHRPRRELGEALRAFDQRQLLQRDLRRSEPVRPHLLDGHLPPGHRRRRQDLPPARREVEARRQPRHLDRSARHRALPRRLRRRPLRELRPRRHLALLREPAGHPVLPRRVDDDAAVLPTSTAARRTTTRSAARRARCASRARPTRTGTVTQGGDGF